MRRHLLKPDCRGLPVVRGNRRAVTLCEPPAVNEPEAPRTSYTFPVQTNSSPVGPPTSESPGHGFTQTDAWAHYVDCWLDQ